MDPAASPRLRTALWLLAFLAVLALAAVAIWEQQRRGTSLRLTLAAQLAADHVAYLARDDQRPVLHGDPQPGNAWEAYAQAFHLITTTPGLLVEAALEECVTGSRTPSAAELAAWQPPLESLRRGARCANARSLVDLRAGYQAAMPEINAMIDLGRAATVMARHTMAAGALRAGLEYLLDGLTLALDLRRSPVLLEQAIGASLLQRLCTEGISDPILAMLGPEELRLVGDALAIADSWAPVAVNTEGEALLAAHHLLDRKLTEHEPGIPIWHAWRHGFSLQYLGLDTLQQLREHAMAIARGSGQDWPRREAQLQSLANTIRSSDNALLRWHATSYLDLEYDLRRAVATLRLLRLVVAERQGQSLELADPLGSGNLQRVVGVGEEAGRVRFASAGTSRGVGTSGGQVLSRSVMR